MNPKQSIYKSTAKKIVGIKRWEQLRNIRKWLRANRGQSNHLSRTRSWSLFLRVLLKENIRPVAFLDYEKEDIKMSVDSTSNLTRLYACRKEPETVQWIENYMRPHKVFYDIGASLGSYSLIAASVSNHTGKIFSFEPSPLSFRTLARNILLNHCEAEITPLNIALGDVSGLAVLKDENSLQSLVLKLDDVIRQLKLPPPNLIKIDVDRAEYKILQGASDVLSHPGLQTLLIEIEENKYPQQEEVEVMLKKQGFKVAAKYPRGKSTETRLFNYIFVK